MTPSDLQHIGQALYAVPQWHAQMARDLGLSLVHFSRLISGKTPINKKREAAIWSLVDQRLQAIGMLFSDVPAES